MLQTGERAWSKRVLSLTHLLPPTYPRLEPPLPMGPRPPAQSLTGPAKDLLVPSVKASELYGTRCNHVVRG